jgi:hypothetical protein
LAREPFVKGGAYDQLIIRRFMMGVNRLPQQYWPVRSGG